MIQEPPAEVRHSAFEDAQALVICALFVALGFALFALNLVIAINHKPGRYLGV